MSIPKFLQDLAVISKLSDLPNSNDGLTAAELKAKFDEAPLAVQKYINEVMIPAIVARKIPFAASAAINADNIQSAIELVQEQIAEVSSGTIANGAVTKEKLSAEVIARCFGGVPWVSMEEPNGDDNGENFPIGQLWLRPGFTVTNFAGQSWTGNGCTVTDGVVQGNKSSSTATASQTLTGIGQAGDRVLVLFDIADKNAEVKSITVKLNGGTAVDASEGMFETTLDSSGSLRVEFATTWSSAALAYEGWKLSDYTVVVPDVAVRQTDNAEEPKDWMAFVMAMQPFEEVHFPATVWMQTVSGIWWPLLVQAEGNEILLGNGQSLAAAQEDGSFLRYMGGQPVWQDKEAVVYDLGALRMMSGSYTGSGANQIVSLPVAPAVLIIAPQDGAQESGGSMRGYYDNPTVLLNGASAAVEYMEGTKILDSSVSLSGAELSLFGDSSRGPIKFCNRSGVVYHWVAIY